MVPQSPDDWAPMTTLDLVQLLDFLPDGITVHDRDFTVIYQNKAMREAFGPHVGAKCYAVYERRDSICEGCGLARAYETRKPVLVLRTAFDVSGGTSFWENACFPICDGEGNIVAGAEVCRSVTDRVNLEENVKERNIELGQANKQLRVQSARLAEALERLRIETEQRQQVEMELRFAQKLQAVGQLAAGIAHEINTPAQFVGDSIHFLEDSFRDAQALINAYRSILAGLTDAPGFEEAVAKIEQAEQEADASYIEEHAPGAFSRARDGISRISSIVSAMKEFAHPDSREKSSADLNRALDNTLTIARNEYKYVADVETDFGELPLVPCHVADLNQVFVNLVVNAAHAIADAVKDKGERGVIRVRTRCEADQVRIDIADTGAGIPEEIQERIFEPFFTTKEVGRGTGQGLPIARSIVVDKHQGSITFQSQVGYGTTFTILLPVGTAANKESESKT